MNMLVIINGDNSGRTGICYTYDTFRFTLRVRMLK